MSSIIMSATCSSISDVGGYIFVKLTCNNGMDISFQFKSDEPCPYQFRREYSIEINPVVANLRQIN